MLAFGTAEALATPRPQPSGSSEHGRRRSQDKTRIHVGICAGSCKSDGSQRYAVLIGTATDSAGRQQQSHLQRCWAQLASSCRAVWACMQRAVPRDGPHSCGRPLLWAITRKLPPKWRPRPRTVLHISGVLCMVQRVRSRSRSAASRAHLCWVRELAESTLPRRAVNSARRAAKTHKGSDQLMLVSELL